MKPSGKWGDGTNCQADDDGAGFAHEVLEFNGQWYLTGVVGRDGQFKRKFTPIEWTAESLTLTPDRAAPSQSWQPPRDPQVLAKLRKFQDLKLGFFYCWGTQTQWGTVDQSWCLCPERYDWNITLVGHRAAPLAFVVGTDGLAVVELPAAARAVRQIRLRCVASETVFGIMGITLLEAVN